MTSDATAERLTTADDEARWLTWGTAAGLAAAIALALVGGLPFDLPMPSYRFGVVTPTCGLTRGSTAIARGDLGLAWRYNPASFAVMSIGALGVGRTIVGVVSGRWLVADLPRSRRIWVVIAVLAVALWLHQQSNADFIIDSRL